MLKRGDLIVTLSILFLCFHTVNVSLPATEFVYIVKIDVTHDVLVGTIESSYDL